METLYTKQQIIDILLELSPNETELDDFPEIGSDYEKVEWGMQKAYVHDTEVINNFISRLNDGKS